MVVKQLADGKWAVLDGERVVKGGIRDARRGVSLTGPPGAPGDLGAAR